MSSTKPAIKVFLYDNYERLAGRLAEEILIFSQSVIERKGRLNMVLAGGSTPKGIYRRMAEPPLKDEFEWSKIHFFWGDERWVPIADIRSNYRMAAEALLTKVDIPIENIHPIVAKKENPETSALDYEKELISYFGLAEGEVPEFDLVLLGLGADGHIASLFPGVPALSEEKRLVVTTSDEDIVEPRVTLTFPVINHADQIIFIVSGSEKASIVHEILEPREGHPILPAQMIWPDHGALCWFIDKAAASLLQKVQKAL